MLGSLLLCATLLPVPAFAGDSVGVDGEITFNDISLGDRAGITYRRTPSARHQERQEIFDALPIPIGEFLSETRPNYPMKPRGNPGVAILDFDGDGDNDLYVSNGPGTANSLYSSQLAETGNLTFVDVAADAGVTATAQDSSGVCFGDIDNDGDADLYVTGLGEANILYENRGDGTFQDITAFSATGDTGHANGCSFGDVDNDGLLDLVVGNSWDDWTHRLFGVVGPTYPGLEHNVLYRNLGSNRFEDVSASSGIRNVSNMNHPGLSGAALTWAIALYDADQDGDVDLLSADTQGGAPTTSAERRGWNRLFLNDGTGQFTDVTQLIGLDEEGGWMGLSFGDPNCDGNLDFFATNIGDYGGPGAHNTLWLRDDDGNYEPGGALEANPFGWGTSMFDYDNDGDTDLIYHGGFDLLNLIFADNPGALLRNQGQCSGELLWDSSAISVDHRLRQVHGVATGDLNDDGFMDMVSVSSFDIVPDNNFLPYTLITGPLGSPFDDVVAFENVLTGRILPGFVSEANPDLELPNGTLSIEISSADNGNGWVKVTTLGAAGILPTGTVNRDGIGAVVSFTPHGGPTSIYPVVGGASYASQNSLTLGFGLGAAPMGDLEILWPGGVRNRLRNVRAGESIVFPEIPCSLDDARTNRGAYSKCVTQSVRELRKAGAMDQQMANRFLSSALAN